MLAYVAIVQLHVAHMCWFFPFASDVELLANIYPSPVAAADEICAKAYSHKYPRFGGRLDVPVHGIVVTGYVQRWDTKDGK